MLRIVGVGILLIGIVFVALAYASGQHGEEAFLQWVIGIAGCAVGLFVLGFSSSLARLLTRDYE